MWQHTQTRVQINDDHDPRELAPSVDLQAKLEEVVAERARLLDTARRSQAYLENLRRRAQRDVAQAHDRGIAKAVRELLSVVDTLTRAVAAATDDSPLAAGVHAMQAETHAALGRLGVTPFVPLGDAFDPHTMEAISMCPPGDGEQAGCVVSVLQDGYLHGDAVLRPARVVVAS
jgi:molecular chaperone GrpE